MIAITTNSGENAYIDPAQIAAIIAGRDAAHIIVAGEKINIPKDTNINEIIDAWRNAQTTKSQPQPPIVASRGKTRG